VSVVLADPDVALYHGDALEVLRTLPDASVHCCVTSPPFYGLRDYGTGSWEGGDPDCDHRRPVSQRSRASSRLEGGKATVAEAQTGYRDRCRCGAERVDDQVGLEPTPDAYITRLVEIFRELRRVLRDDGTLWLELGDSYASQPGGDPRTGFNSRYFGKDYRPGKQAAAADHFPATLDRRAAGTKRKDLLGIPWRVAFALQQDGWWLRAEIIWAKPNAMPESVRDRPTRAHSTLFLLAKSGRYFYDQDAVREPWADNRNGASGARPGTPEAYADAAGRAGDTGLARFNTGARHGRGGLEGGAYAPPGQTPHGNARGPDGRHKTTVTAGDGSVQHRDGERWPNPNGRNMRSVWTIPTSGYDGAHYAVFPAELARRCIAAGCPEGGTVLDPFVGSGTVPDVARRMGRHAIGIDLNPAYLREHAAARLAQLSLFAQPTEEVPA